MLIKKSETRWIRNQYMSRRRRIAVKRTRMFLSLKGKTWLSILLVIMVTGILVTPGWLSRQYEKTDAAIQQSVSLPKAWAAQPSPTMVELAPVEERDEVIALIKKIWGRDADTGLGIARCESGYRVKAINNNTNNTQDQGIFQVNTVHGMPDMLNATANVSYAYTLFLQQGTNPWDSSKHCWGN